MAKTVCSSCGKAKPIIDLNRCEQCLGRLERVTRGVAAGFGMRYIRNAKLVELERRQARRRRS